MKDKMKDIEYKLGILLAQYNRFARKEIDTAIMNNYKACGLIDALTVLIGELEGFRADKVLSIADDIERQEILSATIDAQLEKEELEEDQSRLEMEVARQEYLAEKAGQGDDDMGFWRSINQEAAEQVLESIDPDWKDKFTIGEDGFLVQDWERALGFYKPSFNVIWPILQEMDEV